MKTTQIIVTTVLTTLSVLALFGAFAWTLSPAAAIASSLHADSSAQIGSHCSHFDSDHTRLLDAYVTVTLDLDDAQQHTLTPLIEIIEAWRQDTVVSCEQASFQDIDSSLTALQDFLGRSEQAVADLRPAFDDFTAALTPEQRAELDGFLDHHSQPGMHRSGRRWH